MLRGLSHSLLNNTGAESPLDLGIRDLVVASRVTNGSVLDDVIIHSP
jgi:hypothetical protein